jgi:hypothetical protein
MKILIFLGGIIFDVDNKPISDSIKKINTWIESGADVQFLTKRNGFVELKSLKDACKENGLNTEHIHARLGDMKFVDMVEDYKPRVLIETQASGEKDQPIGARVNQEMRIHSILVKAGIGLDDLPDKPEELTLWGEEKIIA